MKYKVTNHNISIWVEDTEIESAVLSALCVLVPRHTKKLYFSGFTDRKYEIIEREASERSDFSVLDPKSNFETLIKKTRIVHNDDGLFIVPKLHGKLDMNEWKAVCREIQCGFDKRNTEQEGRA